MNDITPKAPIDPEKVKRGASAICLSRGLLPDITYYENGRRKQAWELYENDARAVLEATQGD